MSRRVLMCRGRRRNSVPLLLLLVFLHQFQYVSIVMDRERRAEVKGLKKRFINLIFKRLNLISEKQKMCCLVLIEVEMNKLHVFRDLDFDYCMRICLQREREKFKMKIYSIMEEKT